MIFAFLVCMTASFAATDQDMQLNIADDDVISIDENLNEQSSQETNEQNDNLSVVDDGSEDLLKDTGTFQEIKDKITSASTGGTVDLKNLVYSRSGDTGSISISKELTIDGHGAIIDGGDYGTIFSVTTTSKVIFKNITIQHAGIHAVHFTNTANFEFMNCTIKDNTFTLSSSQGGAAIYFSSGIRQGSQFKDVIFENNQVISRNQYYDPHVGQQYISLGMQDIVFLIMLHSGKIHHQTFRLT